MLDTFLTGENVKVNGEIAGHRHILRTLYTGTILDRFDCIFVIIIIM